MTIMLLAAGEGQRLRPYTLETPKPAMPILNIPMACYSLNQCLELEPKRIVVNTFHLPEKIKQLYLVQIEKFRKQLHSNVELIFSDEKPGGELLGGAGGMALAKNYLIGNGAFLVMNADEVFLPKTANTFAKMYGYFSAAKPLAILMTTNHSEVGDKFGGVWVDSNYQVLGFGKNRFSDKGLHFIGPMLFSDRIFKYIKESGPSNILYDALTMAISQGEKVIAYNIECEWFETGNPVDYQNTNNELQKMINEKSSKYLLDLVKIWG